MSVTQIHHKICSCGTSANFITVIIIVVEMLEFAFYSNSNLSNLQLISCGIVVFCVKKNTQNTTIPYEINSLPYKENNILVLFLFQVILDSMKGISSSKDLNSLIWLACHSVTAYS